MTPGHIARRPPLEAVCFLVAFLMALGLQRLGGAGSAELGGHPDEAAHFVTGLMVRDYLVAVGSGEADSPVAFARRYYDALPRVALGHYPPLFYALEGLWLLPRPTPSAAFALVATLSAALSAAVFAWLRHHTPAAPAWIAALAVQLLPWVRELQLLVMSDLLVCLLAIAAGAVWMWFMDRPAFKTAFAFGLLAAAAILTKGTALFLALFPPLCILLERRWNLLRHPALYLAPAPVLLFAAPWMVATYGITREGMADEPVFAYMLRALNTYPRETWPVLLPLMAGALAAWMHPTIRPAATRWIAFAGANGLFTLIVPSGIDSRYLLPAALGLLLASALGVASRPGWLWRAGLSALVFAGWLLEPVSPKRFRGFGEAAALASTGRGPVLIVSDARGEGAFITEYAVREARPGRRVLRSSKLMAESDWLGRGYTTKIRDLQALDDVLVGMGVDRVVVDASVPETHRKPHHELAVAWATRNDSTYRVTGEILGERGSQGQSVPTRIVVLERRIHGVAPSRKSAD